MKNKKIPMRSCIVSREKLPKKELIRIIKNNDNEVLIDLTGKINGHGVYIKKDINVLEKAIKSKIIERNLGISINDSMYKELRNIIEEK